MKTSRLIALVSFFASVACGAAFAEGMYIPIKDKLPLQEMKEIGLTIAPRKVVGLARGAVASLGGCSSTFVSESGLLSTNWHCAEGCATSVSQKARQENGPLAHIRKDGFVAKVWKDEPSCEGMEVRVPIDIQNVSARFREFDEDVKLQPKEREDKTRRRKEEIREACMKGRKGTIVCDVAFMNNEEEPWYLYTYRRYTDVRLTWFPPEIIGYFGGEKDNWEYPRHTGDFAFLRVYDKGRPIRPVQWARVSGAGVKPNEPLFILGYPGRTERNISSVEAKFMQETDLPMAAGVYLAMQRAVEKLGPDPTGGAYASAWFYLANYAENFGRQIDLMKRIGVVDKKKEEERAAKVDPKILENVRSIEASLRRVFPTYYLLRFMTGRASPAKSLVTAADLWSWSSQPSEDIDRSVERYKSWQEEQLKGQIQRLDRTITFDGETKLLAALFEMALSQPRPSRTIEELQAEAGGGSLAMARYVLAGTTMVARNDTKEELDRARARREEMFTLTPRQLVATKDRLVLLAKRLLAEFQNLQEDWEYGAADKYELPEVRYRMNLMMERPFPDANSTIRFTASSVQPSYKPTDKPGTFGWVTTLSSMVGLDRSVKDPKNPDHEFFLVPESLKKAHARLSAFRDRYYVDKTVGDVPVNFITKHVITGGNSGSGVFNDKGELVGWAFDSTPEGILSDVWPHPEQRTIIVDARYAAFLANEVYPEAKAVLSELGLPVF